MDEITNIENARKSRRQFRMALHQVARELREIEGRIEELAVKLAAAGPLRVWSESMPVGAVARINERMLREIGDPRVNSLLALRDTVYETVVQLYQASAK